MRTATSPTSSTGCRDAGIDQVTVMSGPTSPDLTENLSEGMHVVTVDAWAEAHRWTVAVIDLG